MTKKFVVIIFVILALALSACSTSASTPPPTTTKKNNAQPLASPTIDMDTVASAATLTKIALEGTPTDDGLGPIGDETVTATPALEQPTLDPNLPTPTGDIAQLSSPTPGPKQANPTVQVVRPTTYTLKQGEFIFCLARRFNVDPAETLSLNGLVDSETIYAGLTVKIPTNSTFPGTRALKAHPATYTVQSGTTESIYSVACLYGDVDPMNIAAVNNLSAPYTLTTGMKLQIP